MYTHILVPVDLDHAEKLSKALYLAGQTARESDAAITYVGVVDAVPTTSAHIEGEKLAERLNDFSAMQANTFEIKAKGHVTLRGDLHLNLGKDIVKTATDLDCDLIIMASHVPGMKDHIFSSNAGYVASHAPMSVHVVR